MQPGASGFDSYLPLFVFVQLVYLYPTAFGDPVSFDGNGNALPIYDIANWGWQADGKTRIQNMLKDPQLKVKSLQSTRIKSSGTLSPGR